MLYHVFVCLRVYIKVQLWLEEVQRGDDDEAHVSHHRRRDALQLVLDEKEGRKEGTPPLRKKTPKLQSRQPYSTHTKSHQICQVAQIHRLPKAEKDSPFQNKSPTHDRPVLPHSRSKPNQSSLQTPQKVQTRR